MKRALLAVTMVCFAMINATAATWHVPTLIMPAAIEIKSIKEISPYLASGDTVEVRTILELAGVKDVNAKILSRSNGRYDEQLNKSKRSFH